MNGSTTDVTEQTQSAILAALEPETLPIRLRELRRRLGRVPSTTLSHALDELERRGFIVVAALSEYNDIIPTYAITNQGRDRLEEHKSGQAANPARTPARAADSLFPGVLPVLILRQLRRLDASIEDLEAELGFTASVLRPIVDNDLLRVGDATASGRGGRKLQVTADGRLRLEQALVSYRAALDLTPITGRWYPRALSVAVLGMLSRSSATFVWMARRLHVKTDAVNGQVRAMADKGRVAALSQSDGMYKITASGRQYLELAQSSFRLALNQD